MQSLLSAWSIYFWYLWRQETCLTDYQTILLTKWSFLYQEPMEQRAGSRVWPAAGLELRTTTSRCLINWDPLLVIKGRLLFPALEEPLVTFNNWFVRVFPLNPFFFLTCGKSDWGTLVSVCSLFLPLEVAYFNDRLSPKMVPVCCSLSDTAWKVMFHSTIDSDTRTILHQQSPQLNLMLVDNGTVLRIGLLCRIFCHVFY